jgi:hypothetical protein
VIEVLMPTEAQFAAHERMAALPRIVRKLAMEGDDADADRARLAKLALKASYARLYGLQKIAAESGTTDAALTAAIETAKADITRKKCLKT